MFAAAAIQAMTGRASGELLLPDLLRRTKRETQSYNDTN
jgi:hypothetical protein